METNGRTLGWIALALGGLALFFALGRGAQPMNYGPPWAAQRGGMMQIEPDDGFNQGAAAGRGHAMGQNAPGAGGYEQGFRDGMRAAQGGDEYGRGREHGWGHRHGFLPFMLLGGLFKLMIFGAILFAALRFFRRGPWGRGPWGHHGHHSEGGERKPEPERTDGPSDGPSTDGTIRL